MRKAIEKIKEFVAGMGNANRKDAPEKKAHSDFAGCFLRDIPASYSILIKA